MKSNVFKKTSSLVITLLIVSILTPVLAFAATWVTGGTYNQYSRNVTATVYSDEDPSSSVTLNVYDPSLASLLGSNTVAGSTYTNKWTVNGATYYSYTININDLNSSVYSSVYAQPARNSVTGATYKLTSTEQYNGGGFFPPTTPNAGPSVGNDGKMDVGQLTDYLKNNPNGTITIPGTSVDLPAAAFGAAKTLTIIGVNGASYILPLDKLNLDDLAKELGVDKKDLVIRVEIKKVTGDDAASVTAAASKAGVKVLTDAIDFTVSVLDKAGKAVTINPAHLGNTYISRTLNVTGAVYAEKATGVWIDLTNKTLTFVPSTFAAKDGNTVATLKRNGNSVYTVVEVNKGSNFTDIATHWAKANIQLLANKLIVEGKTDTSFQPQSNITRAEFAALVVRSLGLATGDTTKSKFSDVAAGKWYTGVVNAAVTAGLIEGYQDGTFRPDAKINREELAALVVRASKYAGQELTVSASEQAVLLSNYTDAKAIVWGKNEVAAAVKAGIIEGKTDTTLNTKSNATRAESATMLKRFLAKAGFIN